MSNLGWVFNFGHENNMGFIKFWGYNTMIKEIKNSICNTITYY